MDLYQFNSFDQEARTALIWEQGNFICFREEEDSTIALYDMGKFFAEVRYNAEMNKVKSARGFRSTNCLEPYLEMVDLSSIGL